MADLMSLFCTASNDEASAAKIDHSVGEPMTDVDQVKQAIELYLDFHKINREDPDQAIATLFGLEKLKTFIAMIDAYNSRNEGKEDKVDAVRMYKARSDKNAGKVEVDEVILVPVKANDMDLFHVFNRKRLTGGGDYMLGGGTPCPNLCANNLLSADPATAV